MKLWRIGERYRQAWPHCDECKSLATWIVIDAPLDDGQLGSLQLCEDCILPYRVPTVLSGLAS